MKTESSKAFASRNKDASTDATEYGKERTTSIFWWSISSRSSRRAGKAGLRVSAEAIALLENYDWPGNVRELAAVIERAAAAGRVKRACSPS